MKSIEQQVREINNNRYKSIIPSLTPEQIGELREQGFRIESNLHWEIEDRVGSKRCLRKRFTQSYKATPLDIYITREKISLNYKDSWEEMYYSNSKEFLSVYESIGIKFEELKNKERK